MKVTVLSRGGREIVKGGLSVPDDASVEDLQKALHKHNKLWSPSRQRFTQQATSAGSRPPVLEPGKKLSDYFPAATEATVIFKDLGPQIGFRTVFFWEYFGPLALYPLFYFFPGTFYPSSLPAQEAKHPVQTLALAYWSFHYIKRILETYFVHRFSHGTMPVFNLFRNCAYYWIFAVFVSYFVNHPLYTPVPLERARLALACALICQLANFYCHFLLRNLRPPGKKGGYQIPKGFLFEYITCANYTTEILGWLGFNFATQTVAGYLFLLAGTFQMSQWAIAKHKRLRRTFDGQDGRPKYPRRWILLPPVL